ncbi:MAG TPA: FAD-dependent oxidoreductase [Thermoanaerobaculia bacterium]
MAHLTASEIHPTSPIPESVDTLVVGAGMSGLYATWRILGQDPNASVVIFERSPRTGGRLDSDLIQFADGEVVKEEEGGMRFTFDIMDNLMSLLLILGLSDEVVPFPMNPNGNNRLFFRGRSFTNDEAAEDNYAIWSELYNLLPAEQGVNPSSIIDTVFNRILAANPQFKERPKERTPGFWQRFRVDCQWNGVLLKDWSLWNLFADMGYSNECIVLLYGLAGFNGTYLSKMNAGEAFQLLEDFPAEPDFKTLADGYSTLPNALVQAVGTERIFLNTNLESIDEKTDDGWLVTYRAVGKDGLPKEGKLRAKRVILGLPRLALEELYGGSDALNKLPNGQAEKLWNNLQTSTNQPLAKLNLYYDQAWWGNNLTGRPPVGYGPSFSDLPLGSVYPFYTINEAAFAALEFEAWLAKHPHPIPEELREKLEEIDSEKFNQPAALTIYCDFLNINFWRALQENGPRFDSPMQREYSGKKPQTIFPASEALVETATRFFQELFDTHYVPRPAMTSARIWEGSTLFHQPRGERFDYGVHQWGLHADDREVIPYLVEPVPGIYTCNEAYSDYQGWVEGSLRSTNLVLEKAFGLKPISVVYTEEHGVTPSAAMKAAYAKSSAALIRKYLDPHFGEQQEKELAAVQTKHHAKPFGVSLTYFDQR